jgi:hypothetical protein
LLVHHPDDSRDAARNRERKLARVRAGCGARGARLRRRGLRRLVPVRRPARGHRRQGVATAALAGALELIARLGGGRVEGYPEDAGSVPAGFLFNGSLSTYERLGFRRDRRIGKHRWVVTKLLEPTI